MNALLRVVEAGPLCTVQDAGRPALMRFGVPRSGPMDRTAFDLANAALGNPQAATCLEISTGGLVLECLEGQLSVALTGGGFRASCGGTLREGWSAFPVQAGERLAIRAGDWGSWAVLAVAGRIVAPDWLGSTATHAISNLGGGRLQAGRDLRIEDAALRPGRHGRIPALARPEGRLRVTLGPQERFFLPGAVEALLGQPFRLSAARDRMGQRLEGPHLPVAALDMPSEAVLRGAVQVSGDGVATILMADHQTTGGYPKIATVIGPDLDALAQMRVGETVRFVAVTPKEAVGVARATHEAGMARLAAVAGPRDLAGLLAAANLIGGVVNARD